MRRGAVGHARREAAVALVHDARRREARHSGGARLRTAPAARATGRVHRHAPVGPLPQGAERAGCHAGRVGAVPAALRHEHALHPRKRAVHLLAHPASSRRVGGKAAPLATGHLARPALHAPRAVKADGEAPRARVLRRSRDSRPARARGSPCIPRACGFRIRRIRRARVPRTRRARRALRGLRLCAPRARALRGLRPRLHHAPRAPLRIPTHLHPLPPTGLCARGSAWPWRSGTGRSGPHRCRRAPRSRSARRSGRARPGHRAWWRATSRDAA